MYENMVDVLIYLYENYMDGESHPPVDQDELESELSELEKTIQILLLPRDPDDDKNTVLEIRAGTGGAHRRGVPA